MADTQVNQSGGDGGGGSGPLYALIGVLIIVIIVAIIFFAPGMRGTGDGTRDIDADIRIEVPEPASPPGDAGQGTDGGAGPTPGGDAVRG